MPIDHTTPPSIRLWDDRCPYSQTTSTLEITLAKGWLEMWWLAGRQVLEISLVEHIHVSRLEFITSFAFNHGWWCRLSLWLCHPRRRMYVYSLIHLLPFPLWYNFKCIGPLYTPTITIVLFFDYTPPMFPSGKYTWFPPSPLAFS